MMVPATASHVIYSIELHYVSKEAILFHKYNLAKAMGLKHLATVGKALDGGEMP